MYYTIQHFIEKDIKEIEKSVGKIITGEIDAEDLSEDIQERVLKLGTDLLSEIYELLDDEIRESISRKKYWNIEHRNQEKTILDVMGKVTFKRTGYYNKHTNEYVYLLDKVLGFESGQKTTLRAAANALEETIDSSYRKGGKRASFTEELSKQTVKDLVHGTIIEMPIKEPKEKKQVKHLHIVADEDHVAAQYLERKGDLPRDSRGYKINIENSKFVLDKFHMMKYVNKSVTHLLDSAEEGKAEIWQALNSADKDALKSVYKRLLDVTEDENKIEDIKTALKYFLNNWDGIKIKVEDAGGCWKCCAEGQVSHVLSDRMSSRPMGWSTFGCDQMAKFRAFKYNNGKVIDLLKYQKNKQKEQEKREEQEELIKELRKKQTGWDYAERTQAVIPGLEKSNMKWMRSLIDSQVI